MLRLNTDCRSPTLRLKDKKHDSSKGRLSPQKSEIKPDVKETEEGLINLNLTSSQDEIEQENSQMDDRSQKTPSAFDASPWGDQDIGTLMDHSSTVKSITKRGRKKKKKKRPVPKYPCEGNYLQSNREFEEYYATIKYVRDNPDPPPQ